MLGVEAEHAKWLPLEEDEHLGEEEGEGKSALLHKMNHTELSGVV